jgi:hypothetical protein
MRVTGALVRVLGVLALVAACSSTSLVSGDGHHDGGLTDRAQVTDSGRLTCGDAGCAPSELCVFPPCPCIVLGDGAVTCPAPYCAAPTPADPIGCTSVDGIVGPSENFTSIVDAGSRLCRQICI